jgi:hypothetical protein
MSQIYQNFYDLNEHKRLFYVAAEEIANKANARKVYRKKDIKEIIETLKKAKSNPNKKSANEYYLLSTFQVMEIASIEKLIKKLKVAKDTQEIKQICPFEDIFDTIYAAHIIVGHGGVGKMNKECQKKYDNIQKRTKAGNKKVVVKPILSTGFMRRGQMDLINYSTRSYCGYNWIPHYQDHIMT